MTIAILALVVGYVLLAVLVLAVSLYARVHWGLKAGVIVLVSVFYPITYLSLMSLLGWPTSQPLPERFRLVAAQVYEPDKQLRTTGAIYLWAASFAERAGRVTPRAYELPYSEELHTKVAEATKSLQKGVAQMGEITQEDTGGSLPKKITDLTRTSVVASSLTFHALSETILPEK